MRLESTGEGGRDAVTAEELRAKSEHIDDICDELAADYQVPPSALNELRIYAVSLRQQARKLEAEDAS